MTSVDNAVALAQLGFRVFPLHGITPDGICSCMEGVECKRPGKHPRFKNWQEAASSNPLVARVMFESWFVANVGVATGKGLVVVDCDTKDAEVAFIAQFPSPPTYCVRTRQGTHFYFAYPPAENLRTVTAWIPGIDIRAEGGLVVGPGSVHQSGVVYSPCDGAAPEPILCPPALLAALPRVHVRTSSAPRTAIQTVIEMVGADAVVEELYVTPMLETAGGGRNATLFQLACRLYDLIRAGLLFGNRLDQLAFAAERSGLTEQEIRRTITSAIATVNRGAE